MGATTDHYTAYGLKLKEQFKQLRNKPYVKVGVLGNGEKRKTGEELKKREARKNSKSIVLGVRGGGESKATNVEIAVYNEFGTKNIPPRSWMRSTVDAKANNKAFGGWAGDAEVLKKEILAGKLTVKQALGRMGLKIKSDFQAKIRSNIPPPNKLSTIKAKGSSSTLEDTGQLLNGQDFEIHMGR